MDKKKFICPIPPEDWNKKRPRSNRFYKSKPIDMIDVDTGEVLFTFTNAYSVAFWICECGVSSNSDGCRSNIAFVVNKDRIVYGRLWKHNLNVKAEDLI